MNGVRLIRKGNCVFEMRHVAKELDGGATSAGEKRPRLGQREECECMRQRRAGRVAEPREGQRVPLVRHSARSGREEQVPDAVARAAIGLVVEHCSCEHRVFRVEQPFAHGEALPSGEVPPRETRTAATEHRSAARFGQQNSEEATGSRSRHIWIRVGLECERGLISGCSKVPEMHEAILRTGEELV